MIQKSLQIAALYLKMTYSSRATLIFQLLMPLLFTFMVGQGTDNSAPDTSSTTVMFELGVINEDDGALGEMLLELLAADPTLELVEQELETAVSQIEAEEQLAALHIPANFSDGLLSGSGVPLDFYARPDDVRVVQPIEQTILGASTQLEGFVSAAAISTTVADEIGVLSAEERAAYAETAVSLAQDAWQTPPVLLQVNEDEIVTTAVIPDGIQQSSPGMMAMFATFVTVGGAAVLVQERQAGTLRRLLVMPISKGTIVLGKMLGILVTGILQMVILIVAGNLLFGVSWGGAPVALGLVVVAFALAITSLGMMMAALVRTPAQINGISTLLVLSLAALGGAWWPLDIVPSWMQTVGRFSPISWAMDGFHDVITRGFGVTAVLPEVGVLLIFTLFFLFVGIGRFRYE